MHCQRVQMPNGLFAILCSSGQVRRQVCRCRSCAQPAPFLCDFRLGNGKTCDAPICADHAWQPAEDKHLCPQHQLGYRRWLVEQCIPLS